MARRIEAQGKFAASGWTFISTFIATKDHYTVLIKDTSIVMISPIGKRTERTY